MTKNEVKQFIDAMKAAGIKTYAFFDGFETAFWQNETSSVLIPDYSKEILIEARSVIGGRKAFNDGNAFTIAFVPFETIAEARVGIEDMKEMTSTLNALGYSLTDEEYQKIAKAGFRQSFVTNDYNFKPLTEEEYEQLTEEEKAAYDEELKKYNAKKAGISQGGVSVNTGGFPLI